MTENVVMIDRAWLSRLLINASGTPKKCMANIVIALRESLEVSGIAAFNEFTNAVTVARQAPWMLSPPSVACAWTSHDDLSLLQWCQERGLVVDLSTVVEGVALAARDKAYHPVRSYLNALTWDGEERLERWLVTHFGCDPGDKRHSDWLAAVGLKWAVSAVARVMQPGCKADCLPVFEGEQGTGKSTALKIMAGEWFTDEVADIGSKDAAMQLRGAWIIEHAELDAISRADAARFKAFASRTVDRFRPPYGRRVEEVPRQCIFAGTTNADTYLRDETGNRRFWPVRCGKIDLPAIERDRDQLWAEARHWYAEQTPWWLDGEVAVTAKEEQAGRYVGDAWTEIVRDHLIGISETTVAQVLASINLSVERRDQKAMTRVASILITLGWRRVQVRVRGGGDRRWVYRKRNSDELSNVTRSHELF